ncbi:hypothetical protein ACVIW2_003433 [Bradyrhizobium huanghuaihaiense]|uniref:Uncharacterized protein n=1 Tax=Bradyrhizobium huanghuaihaiense TaxID=990078 RepID=A0A562R2G5_9BRAD|nr:hypothetical protein IQ16_06316 [Bradyrhizobium huanghuaihaiense]
MNGGCVHIVIASAAKQSRVFPQNQSGLLRYARNDGTGKSGASRYFAASGGSGGTLSFGASACMVISVIETRS